MDGQHCLHDCSQQVIVDSHKPEEAIVVKKMPNGMVPRLAPSTASSKERKPNVSSTVADNTNSLIFAAVPSAGTIGPPPGCSEQSERGTLPFSVPRMNMSSSNSPATTEN